MPSLVPDQRVRAQQRIMTREGDWTTEVVGRVVWCESRPTGSWFAHGKDNRLWLRRLRLEKDDGELVDLTIDNRTTVTILDDKADA